VPLLVPQQFGEQGGRHLIATAFGVLQGILVEQHRIQFQGPVHQQHLPQVPARAHRPQPGTVGGLAQAEEVADELGRVALLLVGLLAEIARQAPNGTRLRAVRPGRDLREMLLLDRDLELDAVLLYQDALQYAERCRDEVAAALFAELLGDEQGHLAELDRMLADLAAKGCDPARFLEEVCHG